MIYTHLLVNLSYIHLPPQLQIDLESQALLIAVGRVCTHRLRWPVPTAPSSLPHPPKSPSHIQRLSHPPLHALHNWHLGSPALEAGVTAQWHKPWVIFFGLCSEEESSFWGQTGAKLIFTNFPFHEKKSPVGKQSAITVGLVMNPTVSLHLTPLPAHSLRCFSACWYLNKMCPYHSWLWITDIITYLRGKVSSLKFWWLSLPSWWSFTSQIYHTSGKTPIQIT